MWPFNTWAPVLLVVSAVAAGQGCSGKTVSGGGAPSSPPSDAGGNVGVGGSSAAPAPLVCPGAAHWMKRYGDAEDQVGLGVAADAEGNIAIAGTFQGTIDLGGGPLAAPGGAYGVYVARLDPNGQHLWSHAFAGGIDTVAGLGTPFATVAFGSAGTVLLGGEFSGTVDFGGGPVTATSVIGDGFVAAFDPSGDLLWTAHFAGPPAAPANPSSVPAQTIESLAVDPLGDVLALGYRAAGPGGGMFLVKLDPTGKIVWSKDVSSSGTYGATVRVDGSGNVLVSGVADAPVDFGSGPLASATAGTSFFRARLDPAGNPAWSAATPTSGVGLFPGAAMGLDPAGNLLIAGSSADPSLDVGCGTSPPTFPNRVMAFDATNGACRWSAGFTGAGAVLAADPAGNAFVAEAGGADLLAYRDSGGSPACDEGFTGNAATQVYGIAALPSGRVLLTGAFSGTANFVGDPGSVVKSAGLRDAFLASF
jgi:hypothetical protein